MARDDELQDGYMSRVVTFITRLHNNTEHAKPTSSQELISDLVSSTLYPYTHCGPIQRECSGSGARIAPDRKVACYCYLLKCSHMAQLSCHLVVVPEMI